VDGLADRFGVAHPRRDLSQPKPPSHRASNVAAREILGWEPKRSIWPPEAVELIHHTGNSHGEV